MSAVAERVERHAGQVEERALVRPARALGQIAAGLEFLHAFLRGGAVPLEPDCGDVVEAQDPRLEQAAEERMVAGLQLDM
jgi:hypothetical protein